MNKESQDPTSVQPKSSSSDEENQDEDYCLEEHHEEQEKGKETKKNNKRTRSTFETGRALGGHVRTHKNKGPADKDRVQNEESKNKVYSCALCPRTFERKQSLGGHMKYHSNEDKKMKSAVSSLLMLSKSYDQDPNFDR
ncbi:hypothetical protein CsatB_016768 [Cannabis sativa]